jgi:sarcosine oxidase delta subunit
MKKDNRPRLGRIATMRPSNSCRAPTRAWAAHFLFLSCGPNRGIGADRWVHMGGLPFSAAPRAPLTGELIGRLRGRYTCARFADLVGPP